MSMRQTTRDAIAALNEQFMAAANRQDAAAMAQLYTQDGQLLFHGQDVITGREAIQAAYQSGMGGAIQSLRLETVEVEDFGDTAYTVGRYTLEGEGGQVVDHGKYLTILKQEGGQWKYHRDMATSSVTQPPPAA